jgi:hypothetical protein
VRISHYSLHTRPRGASGARHSLRPDFEKGGNLLAHPGRIAPRERRLASAITGAESAGENSNRSLAFAKKYFHFADVIIQINTRFNKTVLQSNVIFR